MSCSHKFVFGAVVFKLSDRSNPGGSARDRYYFDWLYCETCTDSRYINMRQHGTSFEPPLEGTFPAPDTVRVP
jgi:hypothetical protein